MKIRAIEFSDQWHHASIVEDRDGSVHRTVLSVGDDLSALPDHLRTFIEGEWTPAVVDAYAADQAAQAKADVDEAAARAAAEPAPNPILDALAAINARLDKMEGTK